ncbi:hypothetical protein V8E55_008166 [Tylopilus felleus]
MRSSLPLCSTSFRSFFAALAVLLVWTTVVQSAAIGIERIRVDTIDVAENGLSKRDTGDTPVDDAWHTVTLADSKREEELAECNGELWLGPLSAPLEDSAINNDIEISGPAERGLSSRWRAEFTDSWHAAIDTESTGEIEPRGDLSESVDTPVGDRDLWYTRVADTEENEE